MDRFARVLSPCYSRYWVELKFIYVAAIVGPLLQPGAQIEVGADANKALLSQTTNRAQCYCYTQISVKATAEVKKKEEHEAITGLFQCHSITAALVHFPR